MKKGEKTEEKKTRRAKVIINCLARSVEYWHIIIFKQGQKYSSHWIRGSHFL